MSDDKKSNNAANRILYLFLFSGILPLIIIYGVFLHNAGSAFLINIALMTSDLPAVMSATNPLMTKVMDVYCKTAPFIALMAFFATINKRRVSKSVEQKKLIRSALLSPCLYAFFIYMFLFRGLELTTAGRSVRYFSESDVSLLAFYTGFYFLVFIMTYGTLFALAILYRELRKRR